MLSAPAVTVAACGLRPDREESAARHQEHRSQPDHPERREAEQTRAVGTRDGKAVLVAVDLAGRERRKPGRADGVLPVRARPNPAAASAARPNHTQEEP